MYRTKEDEMLDVLLWTIGVVGFLLISIATFGLFPILYYGRWRYVRRHPIDEASLLTNRAKEQALRKEALRRAYLREEEKVKGQL